MARKLQLGKFADSVYYSKETFSWSAETAEGSPKQEAVTVPAGFVCLMDSIPRAFWSNVRPDGAFLQAVVLHDYLYWTQSRTRSEADEIFKQAMVDLGVDARTIALLFNATRIGGQAAWDENAKRKASGEKRILKMFPSDPGVTWAEWSKRRDVFASTQ